MRWVNEVERKKGSGLVNVMEAVVVGSGDEWVGSCGAGKSSPMRLKSHLGVAAAFHRNLIEGNSQM